MNLNYWELCPGHIWEEVDSQFEGAVRCAICGVPGEQREEGGEVFYPAT